MTVYAKIEDNKLITAYNGYNGITGLADSPELCLANGFIAYTEEEVSGYFGGTLRLNNGVLEDATNTPEYLARDKTIKMEQLKRQIWDLEVKRVRAIAEPSQKTETQTWLEFYTSQIQDLRTQIAAL